MAARSRRACLNSWIATSSNRPVCSDQVLNVFITVLDKDVRVGWDRSSLRLEARQHDTWPLREGKSPQLLLALTSQVETMFQFMRPVRPGLGSKP
jgi:hypothetical protein